jgi:hypothetical protein
MTHTCFRRRSRVAFFMAPALLALLTPWMFGQPASGDPPAAKTLRLEGNKLKLKTSIYESARLSSHPVLVVVLHGDLLGFRMVPLTTYHYVFADEATRKIEDVVVAAVLRPGYRDHSGERSEGEQGLATGDNYTPEVVDAVAAVVEQLKADSIRCTQCWLDTRAARRSRTCWAGYLGGGRRATGFVSLRPGRVAQIHAATAGQQSNLVGSDPLTVAARTRGQGLAFGARRSACGGQG